MSNTEIVRYLEMEHLKNAEDTDYRAMEGLIKLRKPQTSNTIEIPRSTHTHSDHVSNLYLM